MRLINLDDILKQFPEADFDGDDLENMKAYPYWKTDITGLFNILKSVPIIEACEDCISIESVIEWLKDKDIIKTKNQEENARRELDTLPSVISSYNSIKTELKPCEDCISREDAIGIVAHTKEMHIDSREQYQINYGTICDIDLALQQLPSVTPQEPILDKIRDEIEEYKSRQLTLAIGVKDLEKGKQIALEYVLAILDKYKAESEDEK